MKDAGKVSRSVRCNGLATTAVIKTFLPGDPEKNGHPVASGDRVLIQGREERSSLSAIVLAGIGEGTVNLLGGGREKLCLLLLRPEAALRTEPRRR